MPLIQERIAFEDQLEPPHVGRRLALGCLQRVMSTFPRFPPHLRSSCLAPLYPNVSPEHFRVSLVPATKRPITIQ